MKIPQQPNLLFSKPKNASSKDFLNWEKTELNWWANRQLKIVAMMSVVQVSAFMFMLLSFYLISLLFG
mgnify:FL=1|tara:strand:+ start:377 stop:580 length:204 start_codon:yes stop_codon:yes gene_type:complete